MYFIVVLTEFIRLNIGLIDVIPVTYFTSSDVRDPGSMNIATYIPIARQLAQ
jgi:hypothetical protein